MAADATLKRTPLYDRHIALGARMVPFAGYEMPVQYPLGVLKEHLWTREHAGLFDVSHMGQAFLIPKDGRYETVASAMERLVPADLLGLEAGQQRYSQLLNAEGGIIDDLMATRLGHPGHEHWLYLVINASRKDIDLAHIAGHLADGIELRRADDLALVALQGPKAAEVLGRLAPAVGDLKFMRSLDLDLGGLWAHVSRSGYTGEDGYEISVKSADAGALVDRLLADEAVKPIGLGARDSLRLEAGLCLYGHDIDETTSPVEAGLVWSIQKRRRAEGGFPGADRVKAELAAGPARKRIGIRPEGRQPVRDGAPVLDASGREIGRVTSGGFGPSVNGPIAMGYVEAASAALDTPLQVVVRDKPLPAKVAALPFVPSRFHK
ncbi:MAG: glycine cleavage system aminomethyltransferase GcvT [Hyphomicrobiaceae bacterium]